MKILDLVLKHKWYDMEKSGEKPEEYRALNYYWMSRLMVEYDRGARLRLTQERAGEFDNIDGLAVNIPSWLNRKDEGLRWKDYTHVRIRRGYTNTTTLFKCEGITIGKGNPAWGAPEEEVFIIKLGERI